MNPTSLRSDAAVLWHLLFSPVRGNTHADRLESFYGKQADHYDSFRSRLLHGRGELLAHIAFPAGGTWVDVGAGTGQNVVDVGPLAASLGEIHLVDLSASLLRIAQRRSAQAGLSNVQTHLVDATLFDRPAASVDVVTFSYSLTMIPDWFETLRLAERWLKPGGTIAVVDFYVSRKYPMAGHRRHGWLRRAFWQHWFAADNVHLTGDHCAMLHRRFEVNRFAERDGKIPYLPLVRAPHYLFWGTKRA